MKIYIHKIVLILFLTCGLSLSQDLIYEYWVQTDAAFWKNDTEFVKDHFAGDNSFINGFRFEGETIEFPVSSLLNKLLYSKGEKDSLDLDKEVALTEQDISKFRIEDDTIQLYRKYKDDWIYLNIVKFSKDTLILKRNNYSETYNRKIFKQNKTLNYDKITFTYNFLWVMNSYIMEIDKSDSIKVWLKRLPEEVNVYKIKLTKTISEKMHFLYSLLNLDELANKSFKGNLDANNASLHIKLNNKYSVDVSYDILSGPIELKWFHVFLSSLSYYVKAKGNHD